ncbi:MAG: response regulator [Pseudomonadota bacterium]
MNADPIPSPTTNLSVLLAPHLPKLRRFARALCGNQTKGDGLVAAVLEALIEDRSVIDLSLPPRVGLYQLFYSLWRATNEAVSAGDAAGATGIRGLTPRSRQILLLTSIEEFTLGEAATIIGVSTQEAEILREDARETLAAEARVEVMIIEDEPIIALDLEGIVGGMGHSVVGIADTHARAVSLAMETKPDLILADIQLADGSSGVEAVEEILRDMTVPVIFITAFPERLLTGERPEPTYLVTKPFRPETVEIAISQALFNRD